MPLPFRHKPTPSRRQPLASRQPATAATRLIALNKPYDVLTQFRDEQGRATLADFVPIPAIYPCGRLNRDSEGLLLLTNDGQLQARIASPRHKLPKTYWAQVEGTATQAQIAQLQRGVLLNDGMTRPAIARVMPEPNNLWPRTPPVRFRKTVPTSWLELTIREGRNRQIRRMTAAVGLPTLRLVRVQIGPWSVAGLLPGQWMELDATQWRKALDSCNGQQA